MAFKKMEAEVIGVVQGVGFRYFVLRVAGLIGVTGWVANLPDGNVKVVAVGTKEQITEFLTSLQEGPEMSRVDDVKFSVQDTDTNEYHSFEIKAY